MGDRGRILQHRFHKSRHKYTAKYGHNDHKICNFRTFFIFTGQKLTEHYTLSEHNISHN